MRQCMPRNASGMVNTVALTSKTLRIAESVPQDLWKADRAVQSLTGTSRQQTVGLFHANCVTLNGQLCVAPWQRLQTGDVLEIRYDPSRRYSPKKRLPRKPDFCILHEDPHLIVVGKPANCLTVPTPNRESNTLIDQIADYLAGPGRGRRHLVRAVHRLDRGVSGVLVFAKQDDAWRGLRRQFETHQPRREYTAIIAGSINDYSATIRSYLATSKSLQRYSTPDAESGEWAVTHYQVEMKLQNATVVRVQLETGRRNQIRVHFAESGHPILGDPRYAAEKAVHRYWRAKRLALHASKLAFEHPVSGQTCQFELPLPDEFDQFIRAARQR